MGKANFAGGGGFVARLAWWKGILCIEALILCGYDRSEVG